MSDLVERLRVRWEATDEPTARKINRWVRERKEALALIESQAAEITRLRQRETEWQPMDSAPKDGTPIIGAFWAIRWADSHRRRDIVRCWYQPEFGAFISSAREMTLAPGLTFEDGTSRQIHSPVIEPVTHWLPIPAPPVSQLKDTTNADK